MRLHADRGNYDREVIYEIIDEALSCHVAFVEDGQPFVIPINYPRIADRLLLHGSPSGRLMQRAQAGEPLCVAITLIDGLVLARSAFNHSVNYRSVVLFGRGYPLTSDEEKLQALEAITEHLVPGRWAEIRRPTVSELKATAVVAIPIESASAKIRSGPPVERQARPRVADLGRSAAPARTALAAGRRPAAGPGHPGAGSRAALSAQVSRRSGVSA